MVRIIFLMDFYTVAVFAEKLNLAKQMTEYLTYDWRKADPRFCNLHHVVTIFHLFSV